MVEAGLNAYDIVALIPIVRGAGGIVTTWDGGDPSKGGAIVAAGDKRAHEQALEALNKSRLSRLPLIATGRDRGAFRISSADCPLRDGRHPTT